MDPMWHDRDAVDRFLEAIDWQTLAYDPDTGLNCLNGKPFTGVSKTRRGDGKLQGVTHYKEGVAHGVSAAWYPSGQIKLYSEMAGDVYHGWHIEWYENGTKRLEANYVQGLLEGTTK